MIPRRLAYSYIRFSSEKQHLGDSLRRQVALAEDYAARHDMTLDSQSYRDMGISAYKGRNAVEGKLATFLRAVDGGHVPPHSYLLVESLDRLSRDDVDEALELFLSIVRRDITIVTLTDGHLYSRASIKRDHGISLIISITIMMRAHEESETKSRRNKEAWKARVHRGGILTSIGPSWLKLSNGKWIVHKPTAKVVRRIFEWALEGYGALTIHRLLNEGKVPTFQTAAYWSPGLVTSILKSSSVYGTLDRSRSGGYAIEHYYPVIIPRETFERVRAIATARRWKKTTTSTKVNPSNLFVGMSFCGDCGAKMTVTSGEHDRYLLQCRRAYAKAGCGGRAIANDVIETALFEELLKLQPQSEGEQASRSRGATDALALEREIKAAQAERDGLIRLGLATAHIDSVARELVSAEGRLDLLRSHLKEARRSAALVERKDSDEARHLCAALTGHRTLESDHRAMRVKLSVLTRRVFARIWFDSSRSEMVMIYETGRSAAAHYEPRPLRKRRLRASNHVPLPLTIAPAETFVQGRARMLLAKKVWINRYDARMIQLQRTRLPDLANVVTAGASVYQDACDLAPEEAAELCASDVASSQIVGALE